jgi:hypothetical protein
MPSVIFLNYFGRMFFAILSPRNSSRGWNRTLGLRMKRLVFYHCVTAAGHQESLSENVILSVFRANADCCCSV